MPLLHSDSGAVRLLLDLVTREPQEGRVVATAAVEWLDRRDGEWWPFVRLPVVRLEGASVEALLGGLRDLLQGAAPGFAWANGDPALLGLQLGAGEGSGFVAEVGVDLGAFVAETAGASVAPGAELALFRFGVAAAEAVRFAGALEAQARELGAR